MVRPTAMARPSMATTVGRTGWCLILLCLGCDSPAPPQGPTLDLPDRSSNAMSGVNVALEIRNFDVEAREEQIYAEIANGNVPGWLRRLERVDLTRVVDGRERTVTFWVTPDYLSIGSDDDYLLVPVTPQLAQRVADLVGASLPTPRMVDAIWSSARTRLAPIRIEPDEFMTTMRYFVRHDRLIEAQRRLYKVPAGAFVAGHKKDVVLSAALAENPGQVAIYGWHGVNGEPLQDFSTVLENTWVGYNHGARLVDRSILVDGVQMDLREVLQDPQLASLLSDEGVIAEAAYPLQPREP